MLTRTLQLKVLHLFSAFLCIILFSTISAPFSSLFLFQAVNTRCFYLHLYSVAFSLPQGYRFTKALTQNIKLRNNYESY